MNQRFLMWGLASITFVVTAAVNSWHDGLWQSEETLPAPAHGVRTASFEVADETTNVPSRPFAPTHAAPPAPVTVAAVTPPPPAPTVQEEAAPPPVEPSTQPSAQELDEADFQAHSDRAAERSARSH